MKEPNGGNYQNYMNNNYQEIKNNRNLQPINNNLINELNNYKNVNEKIINIQ